MKSYIFFLLVLTLSLKIAVVLNKKINSQTQTTKEEVFGEKKLNELEKYTIENLGNAKINPGKIFISKVLKNNDNSSYIFELEFNPNLDGKTLKKTTGLLNIPKNTLSYKKYPVIVMFRGYVDKEIYKTGDGTRKASEFFSKNGFVTISPDFLGYAGSDKESENIFEARFQTYVTALSLINTLEASSQNPDIIQVSTEIRDYQKIKNLLSDFSNIFIWGHSNGGQIALTFLEITQEKYPTTLWAPVSIYFPYSILYYTDNSEDRGKFLRRQLSKFEEDYDTNLFSLDMYLDRIKAPLQIHQGLRDDAVPSAWNDSLVNKLKERGVNVVYYKYEGADHNMVPVWEEVVKKDINFFSKYLNSEF